jgi:hypothetical protein
MAEPGDAGAEVQVLVPAGMRARIARALLAFLTIVVGVLVALAVDRWMAAKDSVAAEREYLERLATELRSDRAEFQVWKRMLEEKESALHTVERWFRDGTPLPDDPAPLLVAIATGANFGWNAGPMVRSATYAELVGSGSLGLIRNPELRAAIIEYQHLAISTDRRIDPRRTRYPDVAYQLVPRDMQVPNETASEAGLSQDRTGEIVNRIRGSPLREHIVAEINRGRFIRNMYAQLDVAAEELMSRIEAYRQ